MIEFIGVTKKYGSTAAVDNISLTIPPQGIYCLLGRNGAGKTTFMKLLAGHIAATDGEILIEGKHISPAHMPEDVNFITSNAEQFNMKIRDLIDIAAGLQHDFDKEFALKMAERFKLNLDKKFKQLSFGMKTMVSAIITLANRSKIILLDEPTMGFDAIMRDRFNTLLLESYAAHPRVLIVSTHLIDEIAKVTERLIIIEEGKIIVESGIEEIDEKAYTLSGMARDVEPLLANLNCIGKTTAGSLMAAHIYDERIDVPDGVEINRISLQDFFINIVGGKEND